MSATVNGMGFILSGSGSGRGTVGMGSGGGTAGSGRLFELVGIPSDQPGFVRAVDERRALM